MIELHYYPGNASLAPHMVLEEIGVPYRLALVDRTQQAHKAAAYLKLNPNGLIPVLRDGELVLYESAAICLHLADMHPTAGLLAPVGSPARAHAYKWLAWLTNTLQATLLVYFYPERWATELAAIADVKAHAEAKVSMLLDQLDAELSAHGGAWLLGEAYTVVDPYVLMLCRWTRGMVRPARDRAGLGPYLQRALARPAVQRVIEQEGLTGGFV